MRLKDKVVVVTGGSGGIGSATALLCAQEGAKGVALTYFGSAGKADAVVRAIDGAGSKGLALKVDLGKKADVVRAVQTVVDAFGALDGVACVAGHPMDQASWFGDFLELTEEQVARPLDLDVRGTIFTAQAALPVMIRQKKGSLVFFSSTPGLVGDTVGIAYALAKAANANLAKCLAQVYGPHGIRVNAIAPGSIATPANVASLSGKDRAELEGGAALRRFGTPEEVARVAVFLMSDDAAFVTGQTVVCDGGTIYP